MGYASHWTGQIRITPPLSWAEVRSPRRPGLQDVTLHMDETVVDTPTGQVRTVTADAITPISGSPYNGYTIEEEIQAIVGAYPSHEFTGVIEARPEDPGGTPWRYVVQGRRVVRQEPRLVWPDEESADAAQFLALLADLVDPDECWYDHHGYCQAHGWTATDLRCPHARAKELLAQHPTATDKEN